MKQIAALLWIIMLSSCHSNSTDYRQRHGFTTNDDVYKNNSDAEDNASYKNEEDNESDNDEENNESNNDEENNESNNEKPDGIWCADVEYNNTNTGTDNTYQLDVVVESGELVEIEWPNGGWLDESHFTSEDISTGECSFTSDRGYEYTITLNEKGSCGSSDGYRMQNEIRDDIDQQNKNGNSLDDDQNDEDSDE